MKFEWDPVKANANEGKHGVTFDEASTVFGDILSASGRDLEHSVVPDLLLDRRSEFMKKADIKDDEMRSEYARADLGALVRGKYAQRYAKATNVVVIDPALTKAFPNNEAVNNALRSLLAVATAATGRTDRSSRMTRKRVAG